MDIYQKQIIDRIKGVFKMLKKDTSSKNITINNNSQKIFYCDLTFSKDNFRKRVTTFNVKSINGMIQRQ